MLGLDKTPKIVFDITKGNPFQNNYTGRYYLILMPEENSRLETRTYHVKTEPTNFDISISRIENEIVPYISDSEYKYCEVDADCSSSSNFCSSGIFNNYRTLVAYGCERGDNSITDADMKICNLTTHHPQIVYSVPKCIANKCGSESRAVSCVAGAYQEPI